MKDRGLKINCGKFKKGKTAIAFGWEALNKKILACFTKPGKVVAKYGDFIKKTRNRSGFYGVRQRRFELPHPFGRYHLKVVRLPISPSPHFL